MGEEANETGSCCATRGAEPMAGKATEAVGAEAVGVSLIGKCSN
jgi:hypothetical protein